MIVELIRDYISKNGIKHSFIAEKAEISDGLFSRILSGKTNPTIETIEKIVTALKLEIILSPDKQNEILN